MTAVGIVQKAFTLPTYGRKHVSCQLYLRKRFFSRRLPWFIVENLQKGAQIVGRGKFVYVETPRPLIRFVGVLISHYLGTGPDWGVTIFGSAGIPGLLMQRLNMTDTAYLIWVAILSNGERIAT